MIGVALQRASRGLPGGLTVLASVALLACGTTNENKLPPNVQDPATFKTPSGAVARYRGALESVGGALDRVITIGGIMTDELAALPIPLNVTADYTDIDSRDDFTRVSDNLWNRLHRLRGEAHEARGFLVAYAPDSSPALQGHMYAVEAYADVWLADLFCSGIPLSTVDFEANYTLTAGFRTEEVYRHAIALFDSAITLAGDSARVQFLAAVGKGRALLALGRYADATSAVAGVPDGYADSASYLYSFTSIDTKASPDSALLWYFQGTYSSRQGTPGVADREGRHGLDYRSSGDPRTAALLIGTTVRGDTMYLPAKYFEVGEVKFVIASGIEARLIEAEAALQADAGDGRWLDILNHLRQTAWTTIAPPVAEPLPALADPGPDAEGKNGPRIALLFRERAFWLYLTGHRQGDLRRLIRPPYGFPPDSVYPTGLYPGGSGKYGREVVVPVPTSEQELNPNYTGCVQRDV